MTRIWFEFVSEHAELDPIAREDKLEQIIRREGRERKMQQKEPERNNRRKNERWKKSFLRVRNFRCLLKHTTVQKFSQT